MGENGVFQSLVTQAVNIALLEPNWDGYGAPRLDKDLLLLLVLDVHRAAPPSPPDICPGGDGSIQAEWHLRSVEFLYCLEPNGERWALVTDRETGEEWEFSGGEATDALMKWAPRLARAEAALDPGGRIGGK